MLCVGRKRSSSLQNLTGTEGAGVRGLLYIPAALCEAGGISVRGHPGRLGHPARGRPNDICRKWLSPSVPSCPKGLQHPPRELPVAPLFSLDPPHPPVTTPLERITTQQDQTYSQVSTAAETPSLLPVRAKPLGTHLSWF